LKIEWEHKQRDLMYKIKDLETQLKSIEQEERADFLSMEDAGMKMLDIDFIRE